jgi:hypothetical protein
MSADTASIETSSSRAGAGFAGAGGGTLLAVLAAHLPDNDAAKPWLLYLAPSVSIVLSAVWIWVQVQIANRFRDKEVHQLFERARGTLQEALENPNTSPEHRQTLQKQLEELEMLNVKRVMDRIKSLKVITSDDVPKESSRNLRAGARRTSTAK